MVSCVYLEIVTIGKRLYICGDLSKIKLNKIQTYIIREFSSNYENLVNDDNVHVIEPGQVPIVINNEEFEIPLTHNSVILFSVETNSKFLHKIVLDAKPNQKPLQSDHKWLGITFRKSKTFIQFEDNLPYFSKGQLLELANEEQKTEFFKLRGQENRIINFVYPELSYTLSVADRLMPISNQLKIG